MAGLVRIELTGRALCPEFTRNHQAQSIALFGFFEIMRRHKDGRTCIGKSVDESPECAAGQWIDA